MRNTTIFGFLLFSLFTYAQIVIPVNISLPTNDILSNEVSGFNKKITSAHNSLQLNTIASSISISEIERISEITNNKHKKITPSFKNTEKGILNFIEKHSKNYIKTKYPLIKIKSITDPFSNNKIIKNTIIRNRFSKKLNKETNKIKNYFEVENYISEEERLLLVLNSLENIINITLENETY